MGTGREGGDDGDYYGDYGQVEFFLHFSVESLEFFSGVWTRAVSEARQIARSRSWFLSSVREQQICFVKWGKLSSFDKFWGGFFL